MSAANALAVYPQLARGLFGADGSSPELVEHYAEQLARLITHLGAHDPEGTRRAGEPPTP